MATLSEENYLKAIFHLSNYDKTAVSTNAIAQKMETRASSATDMIKKLFEKGLIDYQKYKGVKLTGAEITSDTAKVFSSPIILKVEPPTLDEIEMIKPNAVLISRKTSQTSPWLCSSSIQDPNEIME